MERADTPFTSAYHAGEVIRLPIGHGDGRYVATEDDLDVLEAGEQVVLRYSDQGIPDAPANPNGAMRDIAGICNRAGNVVGIMPHPERLAETVVGSDAGHRVFASLMAGIHAS